MCTSNNIRMTTTFIKEKLKKSDNQTNMVNYRVAVNITEYRIAIISEFLMIRQIFHGKKIKSKY